MREGLRKCRKVIRNMGYIRSRVSRNKHRGIHICINNGHLVHKVLVFLEILMHGIGNNIMLKKYIIYYIFVGIVWTLAMRVYNPKTHIIIL